MTDLNRTDLPATLKVELAASALATQGIYGANTALADEFGVSRSTVYAAAETAYGVLEEHFVGAEIDERTVMVDERQIERAIGGLRAVSPNSIRGHRSTDSDCVSGCSRVLRKDTSDTGEAGAAGSEVQQGSRPLSYQSRSAR